MKIVDKDADKIILDGTERLYNMVKLVLGPKSRNVLIRRGDSFIMAHDAFTVVDSMTKTIMQEGGDDAYGVGFMSQATNKMNELVGDGKTTVTILSRNFQKALKELVEQGENPMLLQKQAKELSDKIVSHIKDLSEDVTPKTLEHATTVSSGDKEIGSIVAKVVGHTGKDGLVTTQRHSQSTTTYELTEGCRLDYGIVRKEFLKGEQSRSIEEPNILIVKGRIASFHDLLPLLGQMAEESKNDLVIFAEDFSIETLANLSKNNANGVLNVIPVELPSYALIKPEDIAALTGAFVIDSGAGIDIKRVGVDVLGKCKQVYSNLIETKIIGGDDITEYKESIKEEDMAQERIAMLEGRAAIIHVGGMSSTEIIKKERSIQDAVFTAEAALRNGILPGGGIVLYQVSKKLSDKGLEGAVAKALRKPYEILLENGVIDFVEPTETQGVNVLTGEFVDMKKSGIVDATEIETTAVEVAMDIAGQSITTGGIIDENE